MPLGGNSSRSITLQSARECHCKVAQVTDCVPAGQLPLLWMSPTDPQAPDTALRGGIPLCWPWFADARPGPAHGIARTSHWQLQAAGSTEAGVQLVLQLPEQELRRQLPDELWSVAPVRM